MASGVPFVSAEAGVIVGVDDGVFALGEGYSAERVAVAEAAIEKQKPDDRLFEDLGDVKDELDNCPPR